MFDLFAHVTTVWNQITVASTAIFETAEHSTVWSQVSVLNRTMVVWDAGLETPESSTFWDNGATNWVE